MRKPFILQSGFSFTEVIVVISIFTVLTVAIFGAAQSFYQQYGQASAQANEVDNARRGVTVLARDLREMTYAENGTFPVSEIEEHTIGFYSDIDKDNSVEYVRYELEVGGTDFYKRTYNPIGNPPVYDLDTPDEEVLLSRFVQNRDQALSTFLYYDSNHAVLTGGSQLTDVRFIEAQLIVNIDPIRSPGEFLLRTSVAPRNLKDNL